MGNSHIEIRTMTQADINRVVDIHLQVFEGFFLAFLGPRFLTTLYSAIVDDPTGISFIAIDNQNILGFVAGTTEAAGFYRRLIKRSLWRFCIASFQPVVKNPRILPRLFRALSMPRNAALPEGWGLLMSIGVSSEKQNKGTGHLLLDAFIEETKKRGLEKVYLTTDKNNNEKVNTLYKKIGFRCDSSYATPEGRLMNEYIIDLQDLSLLTVHRISNMQSGTLAKFFERQGYRIIKSESCLWYAAEPGCYFNIPYHRLVNPSKEELNRILWGIPCIFVRYFTPIDYIGKSSYMIVCSDKNYDITSVDAKNARRQTRRGLENFQIRQLDFNELADYNWINVDTLMRQGRKTGIWTEKKWRLFCSSTTKLSGLEAWGAFYENKLAAFLVAYQMDDYFYIFHHSSATKPLQLYPNNALIFFVTKLKLTSNEINYVSYGPQSLDAPASLETFKFRMGFRKLPIKQVIVFHPFIKPFITSFAYKFIKLIASTSSEDFWRKFEAILRFYRETS